QLAAIADPEARREAQRDADERADREARMQAQSLYAGAPDNVPPPGASAPAYAPAGTPAADVQVARGASAPAINPAVQAGYAAFGAGDLATARLQYAAALRQDPNNRDALLGSAVIAARERRDDDAAGFYARLLAANPRDVEAIAGLAGLRPGDGDRAEIRLKGVLRNNQDAPSVHFALGNLYARQGRWQEAQQAYFRAWSAAPDNADYAFNLAVGLDRLNQGRLARDYYGRALALAAGGAAAFDRMAVQRRMQELAPAGAAAAAPLTVPAPVPADAQVPAARVGN
ncbi:tetratricopeptide repeat protein, partial [Pseudoduganella dura]